MAETAQHFFKIILASTLEDKKLRIPEKFVRKFQDELLVSAALTVPNGRVWQVGLSSEGGKIWFLDGWNDFMEYHSIRVGYFLVFKYERSSKFHVLIFDTTCCEIQYPYSFKEPKNEQNSIPLDGTSYLNPVSLEECEKEEEEEDNDHDDDDIDDSHEGNYNEEDTKEEEDDDDDEAPKRKRRAQSGGIYETKESSALLKGKGIASPLTITSRREMENATNKRYPDFFKVYLPARNSHRLHIPDCFEACCGRTLSKKVMLSNHTGKCWHVDMTRIEKGVYFLNGWHKFVQDNSLQYGDFLVFKYNVDCGFYVKHLGQFEPENSKSGASGTSYLNPVSLEECEEKEEDNDHDDDDINDSHEGNYNEEEAEEDTTEEEEEDDDDEAPKRKGRAQSGGIYETNELFVLLEGKGIALSRKYIVSSAKEGDRILSVAKSLKPQYPSFMIFLRQGHMSSRLVYLPAKFVNKYVSKGAKCIILQVPNGRKWPVQICWNNHACYTRKGWTAFVTDMKLKVDDICLFELISMEDLLLKVSVFSTVESNITY